MKRENIQLVLRAFVLWLLLMSLEFLHGLWRTKVLALWIGDFPARQVCVFTDSALILFVTYVCIQWIPATKTRTLLSIGLAWLGLTLVFDLPFGHFVLHRSWKDLGADFNLFHWGMFPIGLAVLTLSPLIAARWRGFASGTRLSTPPRPNVTHITICRDLTHSSPPDCCVSLNEKVRR
jgi:hypothetical protein